MVVTITSCTMTKRHYAPGYHVEWKNFSKHGTPSLVTHPKQVSETSECLTAGTYDIALNLDLPEVADRVSSTELSPKRELTALIPNKLAVVSQSSKWTEHEIEIFQKNAEKDQNYDVEVAATDGVEGVTWLIYLGIVFLLVLLSSYFFGVGALLSGPIFIALWTSIVDGEIKWKPVLTSLLLWLLCGLPGFIHDIIWISKNCKGRSLFTKD